MISNLIHSMGHACLQGIMSNTCRTDTTTTIPCTCQGLRDNAGFFPAHYALFFGELRAPNPELCEFCNIF